MCNVNIFSWFSHLTTIKNGFNIRINGTFQKKLKCKIHYFKNQLQKSMSLIFFSGKCFLILNRYEYNVNILNLSRSCVYESRLGLIPKR